MLPGEECWIPMVSTAPMTMACSSYEPAQNTSSSWLTPTSATRCDIRPPGCTFGRDTGTCWTMSSSEGENSGTGCVNCGTRSNRRSWLSSVAHVANTSNLLAEKNSLHKAYVTRPTDDKAAFYCNRRLVQQRLREMQDVWTARKAKEIQGYAVRNEWKVFFFAIKTAYGSPTKATAPLLSADGNTLLTDKIQILQRWAEHFRNVLNSLSSISDAVIARVP
nr:unnamed protein product [Spirometra erinaceieuropaei]